MSIQPAWQEVLDSFAPLPIVLEPSSTQLTRDAGLLPLRHFDNQIGWTRDLANALRDPRDPRRTTHSYADMLRLRLFGILADYPDQNDLDTLRTDPVFKLIAGRLPTAADLVSQPTLSRFENHIDIASLKRMRDVFLDHFVASFSQMPRQLTFDLDAVDDPAHGNQQLCFWNDYYKQTQYLPLIVSSADNDQLVLLTLRHGTAAGSLGADDDLDYLFRRLRQHWPDVHLRVRGDAAFGAPTLYHVCEAWEAEFTFGLISNPVLLRLSDAYAAETKAQWEQERRTARLEHRTPQPQRHCHGFWYRAEGWPSARWVIVKTEANALGENRRFIVSNRPGAEHYPEGTYDDYAMRGESENRHKELKVDLHMDRMSDHRFLANYFRLYLHAAAFNLLARVRRFVAEPSPANLAEPLAESDATHPALPPLPWHGKPMWTVSGALRSGVAATEVRSFLATALHPADPLLAVPPSCLAEPGSLAWARPVDEAAAFLVAWSSEAPNETAWLGDVALPLADMSMSVDAAAGAAATGSWETIGSPSQADIAMSACWEVDGTAAQTDIVMSACWEMDGTAAQTDIAMSACASLIDDGTRTRRVAPERSACDQELASTAAGPCDSGSALFVRPAEGAEAVTTSPGEPLLVTPSSVPDSPAPIATDRPTWSFPKFLGPPPEPSGSKRSSARSPRWSPESAARATLTFGLPLAPWLMTILLTVGVPNLPIPTAASLPPEALTGESRRRFFRQRRQRDPLGEGQPCTWRTRIIKVAAEIQTSSRRIVVRFAADWPHLAAYQRLCQKLNGPAVDPPPGTG